MSPHRTSTNHSGRLLRRAAVIPFETATAVLAMWTGLASFFGYSVSSTAFQIAVPSQMVVVFNLLYVLAGAFMLAGIVWGYQNVEAAGILLLFTSLVIRLIAVQAHVGFTPITASILVQGVAFGIACVARFIFLLKNEIIVRAGDAPEIIADAEMETKS